MATSDDPVEKVIGEPVFLTSDETTRKIRRNLLTMSFIGIAYTLGNLTIDTDATVFGFKVGGLSDASIAIALLSVISYMFIHFLWVCFDDFLEWRLRITGTSALMKKEIAFKPLHGDYPKNPRQSSLHTWWQDHAVQANAYQESMRDLITVTAECKAVIEAADPNQVLREPGKEVISVRQAAEMIRKLDPAVNRTASRQEELLKTVRAERLSESLRRFDDWTVLFLRSQNLRWLTVDFLLPIALAVYALSLVALKLNS